MRIYEPNSSNQVGNGINNPSSSIIGSGLLIYYDTANPAGYVLAYVNSSLTVSGTIGDSSLVASSSAAGLFEPNEPIRVNGTDIYTISSVSGTTINVTPNLISSYTAGTLLAQNKITTFNDLSSHGNSSTQSTAANRAVLNPVGQNSNPIPDYTVGDSVTYPLPIAAYALGNGPCTIFCIARRNTASGLQIMFNQGTGINSILQTLFFSNAADVVWSNDPNNSDFLSLAGVSTTQFHLFTVTFDGVQTCTLQLDNGIFVSQTGFGLISTITTGFLGSTGTNFGLDGSIPVFAAYNRLLGVGEIASNNIALLKEWGITNAAVTLTEVDGYDVFLMAGQSNMEGITGPVDVTLDPLNPRIAQWGRFGSDDGKIILAINPLQNVDPHGNSIGLAMTFAADYLATISSTRGVLLVPCAFGGSGFANNDWNPGDPNFIDAVSRANAATASKVGNVFKGILWHEGETEGVAGWTQAQYSTAIDAMIPAMRSGITGAALVPFILGEPLIGGNDTTAAVVAALADTPNRNLYTIYEASTGLTSSTDNVHFNPPSLRTYGGRYFAALANFTPMNLSGLVLWQDAAYFSTLPYTFVAMSQTATGTSGTHTIVGSTSFAGIFSPGDEIRVSSTDIYTVSTISTVTMTTNEALVQNYVAALIEIPKVNTWIDTSGLGHNSVQATDANKPFLKPATQNGLNGLDFNATQFMAINSGLFPVPAAANTLFIVANRTTDSGVQIIYNIGTADDATNHGIFFGSAGNVAYRNDNGSGVTITGVTTTNFNIFQGSFNGTTGLSIAMNNGVPVTNTAGAPQTGMTAGYIGGRPGLPLLGTILEIIEYNRLLTSAEIITINQYLGTKWNITIS